MYVSYSGAGRPPGGLFFGASHLADLRAEKFWFSVHPRSVIDSPRELGDNVQVSEENIHIHSRRRLDTDANQCLLSWTGERRPCVSGLRDDIVNMRKFRVGLFIGRNGLDVSRPTFKLV